ncbi:MAG: AI-2E family transporter [Proteobacteria bacterium]|nr:AI-2E family transporter [Pseudomonadota bacterium]
MKQSADRSAGGAVEARSLLIGVALLGVAWWFRGVLMLAFASVLIAVTLDALAGLLTRAVRLPRPAALALVVLLVLGFVAGALALFGWRIADQFDEILARTQSSAAALAATLKEHEWTRELLARLSGARIDGATMQIAPTLATTLGALGQDAAYAAIVVASGVFLAIQPRRHLDGALALVPARHRDAAIAFVRRAGEVLRKWLVSRLIVMLAIGVLSSLGLWLLHIPGALALGLTGGLLTFIPLIGALLAAVPAILVALAQSPAEAVYVALMYWAVHFVEGTFITPYVQDEEVDLPPVLTMYSALLAALVFGAVGVLLSSPIALLAILGLKMFYLREPTTTWTGSQQSSNFKLHSRD